MSDDAKNTKQQVRPEIWDTAAVGRFLGVAAKTVRDYATRGDIPKPDGHLGRTPYWFADTIREHERPGRGRSKPKD
ncbi:MarR family transcriptional regulator [Streptomyces sp. NBC_01314]|uniref:MarR family transcriptional regulator n=1 Tax=Streptomyces sp. NBC_01314 TaxID=2903821 RepID=UPI003089C1E8|nr:MarR family transcriptional regulator [Streptomyces sp. NBC_01314]